MPALVLFGRRWQVGGDDLVFPAIGSVFVRIVFLACTVAIFVVQRPAITACPDGSLLSGFLIGLISILCVTIALETLVGVVSGRGKIWNSEPRKHLPSLLYIRSVVFFAEIGASVVGAVWIFKDWEFDHDKDSCDITVVRLVQAALVASWILLVAVFTAVCILFGGKPGRENDEFDNYNRWERRCRRCCFCERRDENSQVAYAEAAAVFATIFQNYDVVISDIIAGLILVQVEQERRLQNGLPRLPSKDCGPEVALPSDRVESRLEIMWHYYRYSMAATGWPILAHVDMGCCICRLCCTGRYCACGTESSQVYGDNCCHCNTTAVRAMVSADEDDLVYVSFHNKIFQSPFFVVLDHTHKAVVIAIRGTLSFQDMLTDVSAAAEKLEVEGQEIYGHRGIVNNSKNILSQLREKNLLEDTFLRFPNYKLVVCGHSLGAGVAAILSILLRKDYPAVQTFAFSPPGGLLNTEGVLYTQDFVTSLVLGEDVVPRMSMSTLQHLRDEIVSVIRSCSVPKYRVLMRGLWYTLWGLPEQLPIDDEGSEHEDMVRCNPREPLLSSSARESYTQTHTSEDQPVISEPAGNGVPLSGDTALIDVEPTETRSGEPGTSTNGATSCPRGDREFKPLFPPGQMIWIQRRDVHSGKCCGHKEEFTAQWVTYRQFNSIGVKPGMVKDHLPLEIDKSLAWLVDHIKNSHTFHRD